MGKIGHRSDIAAGMSVMLMLSILLSWIPGLGTLIAGIVGGKIASGFTAATIAALLPGLLIGFLLFYMSGIFAGLPVIGSVADMGGVALATIQVSALILGAVIGGLMA